MLFLYFWRDLLTMKRIFFLLPGFLLDYFVFAQKTIPEFGKIDITDLHLKSCVFEPGASAMNLFDVQEIEFKRNEFGSKLITERRVRIKIFNESGYKYASIRIPYFSQKRVTKIKDLSGIVYNLDPSGSIIVQKLEKKDFFKEKAEDKVGIINFTFPNVKPGSIVEFRYTKVEKNIADIDPWAVQDEIPTAYASTVIITPTFSRIKEKIYGTDTIAQKKELLTKGGLDHDKRTYYRENIKSFQPEPFMSSYKDNLLRIIFLLIPESNFFIDALTAPEAIWKYAGSRLLNSLYFGQQIKKTIPGTDNLIDSAKKISAVSNRINFIYEAVQKRSPANIEQTLNADDIIDAWNEGTGNTAEINLILLNLLQKANVQCYPLLISTRNHGKINTDFPSTGQLNGVDVLAIDSNTVYVMDASIKYQSFQNPPLNVMNRKAFLLIPNNMKWVMVDDDRPLLKESTNIVGTIKDNGTMEGEATYWYYDYAKSFMLDSADDDEKEDRFFDKKTQGLKIISVEQKNDDANIGPLERDVEFSYEPQSTNNFYFINPQFLFLKKDNPFTKDTRNTDIDFGCNQQFDIKFQLTIPPSYEIEELPKNIFLRAPDTSFFFKRTCFSDSIHILLSQTFEVKQSIFAREDYPAVKDFFSRAYALMQEEIVLKKKR
jgi:hypothetical protein